MATDPFGADAPRIGAILPTEGRDVIIGSHVFPPGVMEASADGWLAPGVPVLVRGEARILPLAWHGAPGTYNPYADASQIKSFALHVQGAAVHRAGPWSQMELSATSGSIGSYAGALRVAAATRVDCWLYSDETAVVMVWAGVEAEGTASLAVHVVPAAWVSERLNAESVEGVDVRWDWTDVVALREGTTNAHSSLRTDNLDLEDQEDRRS